MHNHPGKNHGNIYIGYGPSDGDKYYAKMVLDWFKNASINPRIYEYRKSTTSW